MFEELFPNRIDVVARHESAPCLAERKRYLEHLKLAGYRRKTIVQQCAYLLWVTRALKLISIRRVTPGQIRQAANRWIQSNPTDRLPSERRWTRKTFVQVATQWMSFLGVLDKPTEHQCRFENLIKDYSTRRQEERGLSPMTLDTQGRNIRAFLCWYEAKRRPMSSIRPVDVDDFLAIQGRTRWCRRTVATAVHSLKMFFRHGFERGWWPRSLADAIEGPRVYAQESLPAGPSWDQVRAILKRADTDRPADIRDRAILMLLAIYGLRAGEVAGLRLEDIDWDQERLHVRRPMNRTTHVYPLVAVVGDAIARYLKEVRPPLSCPEVFIKLKAPLKPISRLCIHRLTNKQLRAADVQTQHLGPHALRHACATHLVSQGLTMKEIGDHLGHRSTAATQIYAKVDLPHLREVANVDLGGLR